MELAANLPFPVNTPILQGKSGLGFLSAKYGIQKI
jgi:hypothetical protein